LKMAIWRSTRNVTMFGKIWWHFHSKL
jgi:hypothetical protein